MKGIYNHLLHDLRREREQEADDSLVELVAIAWAVFFFIFLLITFVAIDKR